MRNSDYVTSQRSVLHDRIGFRIVTSHCPLMQIPLSGLSVHGVPSLTFPKVVVSPSVVAQFRTHLAFPKNSVRKLKWKLISRKASLVLAKCLT